VGLAKSLVLAQQHGRAGAIASSGAMPNGSRGLGCKRMSQFA
jgi:hypothetical protein